MAGRTLCRGIRMKKLALGFLAAATFSGSALAADMAVKAPPMPVSVIYNWTGFYIGGNVGYSWGRESTDGTLTGTQNVSVFRTAGPTLVSSVDSATAGSLRGRANMDGIIGGGQIGYNWQSSQWLFGLEADFQGSDERASADVCTAAGCPVGSSFFTANYKLDWFGTARGRVGFLATDRVLLYATGGLAYGHFSADAPFLPLSWGSTRAGWTVGAGAEAAIGGNWSVKLEYLYMDLGNVGGNGASATTVTNALNTPNQGFNTVTTTTATSAFNTKFTDNIVRVGLNYRFGGPMGGTY
jgi:outer membrane immunogenic protein